jgi:hypothetical protein
VNGGGNPNDGLNGGHSIISHNGGEEYFTARVLASSSVGSFSPEEARVKELLQASASVKHQVFGEMIKAQHDVEEKRLHLIALQGRINKMKSEEEKAKRHISHARRQSEFI